MKIFKHQINIYKVRNCLQISQLENKMSYLQKSKIGVKSLIENHKEFI